MRQTPDSAGTASALNTGVKTKAGVISVQEGLRRGCDCDTASNIAETFAEHVKGQTLRKKVGVVTTARITHATPACVYAHSADRNWEAATVDPVCVCGPGGARCRPQPCSLAA